MYCMNVFILGLIFLNTLIMVIALHKQHTALMAQKVSSAKLEIAELAASSMYHSLKSMRVIHKFNPTYDQVKSLDQVNLALNNDQVRAFERSMWESE